MSFIDTRWSSAGEVDLLAGAVEGPLVLVPSGGEPGDDLLRVAGSLARERDADLLVVGPDDGADGSGGGLFAADGGVAVSVVDGSRAAREGAGSPVRERATASGSVGGVVERAAATLDVAAAVASGADQETGTPYGSVSGLDCDVVFVDDRSALDRVSSVLLAVAAGPHSGFATEVARCVAAANDAWVDVFHVVPPDADRGRQLMAEACVGAGLYLLDGYDRVDRWILEGRDPTAAIVEQSRYYDATVLGAPSAGRLRRVVFGSVAERITAEATGPVLVARSRSSGGSGLLSFGE